ncbi:MAG TPA: glycosyltransferase [Isosphaeraceae bacterium]|jgi:sugar transferase (PEP-CTERM/EpsH1 system associated)|nr:glycosyltransferase [Isosphaeraceae bacterium]
MGAELHVVHVVLSLDVGGLERNVLNQVVHGRGTGQRVSTVCLEQPGALAPQVEAAGAVVICMQKRPGIRPGMISQLIRVFRDLSPDVVHTHQIGTLLYSGPAARWARVPLVVHTEHGKERYAKRLRTRMLGRVAGRFATTFFCLTEDMAAAVRASGIVPGHKLRVISNGIETRQFLERRDTGPARRSLSIPEGAPVIGTVGRLTEVKRQDVLIRGFAQVKQRFPAAHLVLVGDGPILHDLQELAAGLGIADCVHFTGYQSDTAPYLQLMSIFALTSRSEGMPQAALEACVTGLPVVATRVGGLPELVDDGRTGILVPPGDEVALATALCELLVDGLRAQAMGLAGRERAISRFDIRRMAGDYHRHFLDCLAPKLSSFAV